MRTVAGRQDRRPAAHRSLRVLSPTLDSNRATREEGQDRRVDLTSIVAAKGDAEDSVDLVDVASAPDQLPRDER